MVLLLLFMSLTKQTCNVKILTFFILYYVVIIDALYLLLNIQSYKCSVICNLNNIYNFKCD